MKGTRSHLGCLVALLCAVSATASAQQPRITNAKLQTRSAAAGLEKEFRALATAQVAPAWFGYAVPAVSGDHQMCCWNSFDEYRQSGCCGRCRLEGSNNVSINSDDEKNRSVNLEHAFLVVLFRIEQGKAGKVRTFSEDCELDAAGLPVVWFTDVRPAESVALLASFVRSATSAGDDDEDDRRASRSALAAIALHADSSADRALEQFVAANQPESLRKQVTFWLGAARGQHGYQVLERILRDDPSDRVREQAVFGLHVSKVPAALDSMIRVARNDASTHVRGQALFWLAQKAGKKAAEAITTAIENDPETEVKKRAVFALSQLPKDQGVPLLIQVAKTNRNPAVRKQAMFWLGQSNDPRALAFFEEVLR